MVWRRFTCASTPTAPCHERADGAAGGLIHDCNPSLGEVVAHVRAALHASWESVSAARFRDWRSCGALSPSELATHVRLYLNPNASNEAIIGTSARGAQHGVSIMPWGNTFNRCIKYNWAHARVGYSFDCVEQYTIQLSTCSPPKQRTRSSADAAPSIHHRRRRPSATRLRGQYIVNLRGSSWPYPSCRTPGSLCQMARRFGT